MTPPTDDAAGFLTGVILAGGRASRFGGTPKGLARVDGARIVDRVVDALTPVTDARLLIANAAGSADWLPGTRVRGDVFPDHGALGGLHAALAHAGTDVLVVAWDMPFVSAALLDALVAARHGVTPAATAVLPVHPDGHAEPLCALYAAGCVDVAARLLQQGERRAGALADAVGARRLPVADLGHLGDPRTLLLSVNTPDDLARANAACAGPTR